MARPSRQETSSYDTISNSLEEEEQVNYHIEEELEVVARSAVDSDDDEGPDDDADDEAEDADEDGTNNEISKHEKARLKEMLKMKKQKIQEILDEQNAAIDVDMNNRGRGRLMYLLLQTELFAHFAKHDHSASWKKIKGSRLSNFCFFTDLILLLKWRLFDSFLENHKDLVGQQGIETVNIEVAQFSVKSKVFAT